MRDAGSSHPWFVLVVLTAGLLTLATDPCRSRENATSSDDRGAESTTAVSIERLICEKPLTRVGRRAGVEAVLVNTGDTDAELAVTLQVADGMLIEGPGTARRLRLEAGAEERLRWRIGARRPLYGNLKLEVRAGGSSIATASIPMRFLGALPARTPSYIPVPQPIQTRLLVGAHHCPLWEPDEPNMWNNVLTKHQERTPALGFYDQTNPEVADWETKWAVEHGVNFFIYCWYRASKGDAVETRYSSAIHQALFKSKFADRMKFTIMWENQPRDAAWGRSGVSGEKELLETLLPYWLKNYFQHPSYLKVDNKPLLFVYDVHKLARDLGGKQNAPQAFARMREACRQAGFAGLYLLAEYRGLDPNELKLRKEMGFDYTFAYCWPIQNPRRALQTQLDYIRKTRDLDIIPEVVTVSQGWSGWNDEGPLYTLPPAEFETLLQQAGEIVAAMPQDQLSGKLLLLDNWNEWGEGHYLAPYREYGFGYLDAVRKVFGAAPEPHIDLIPEDVGRGPYDTKFFDRLRQQDERRKRLARKVLKAGAPEDGLIGWWAFDETADGAETLDYSGNRLGGSLIEAKRAAGIDDNALVCDGGCAVISSQPRLDPGAALTIACWVRTDLPDQDNKWFVNRVYSGGTDTGYRMGVLKGRPCFEIPQTAWSHHLSADGDLPTGRWVHLAGTFDGATMRIYVDGKPRGAMERPGPIKANRFPLTLGSYEAGHAAHFTGLLDEVRLYRRALSAAELQRHAQPPKQSLN